MSAPGTVAVLTPYQRGQAALANALAQVGYPEGSDEQMQFVCGLCADVLGTVDPSTWFGMVQLRDDLATAKRRADTQDKVLQELVAALAPVLVAFMAQDADKLARALGRFMAAHCKVVMPSQGGLQ